MGYSRCLGRVGALAVALGIGMVAGAPTAMASDPPPPDKTALVLGGTSIPTPDQRYIDLARVLFIEPTQQPGQHVDYISVTTPEEGGPITGVLRVIGLVINPDLAGFDGPLWPDEPLWKLSGIFDLTLTQSIAQGVPLLEAAMAANGNDHLIIFGYSQGAAIANIEKAKLAEQYPEGTEAPDIEFVLIGDTNVPNGGLFARFPGLHIPILDWSFNGPAPTDTQFHTTEYIRQYDGFADFPLYPLNLVSTANAILGIGYSHGFYLNPDPDDPPPVHTQYGDTDYYFQPVNDLPLFGPLRTIGVPEPVIDVFEPVVREIVELGYDRSIPPGEPTPARLIPPLNPATVAGDLVKAVGEGITNAAALIGLPPPLSIPAAPAEITRADVSDQTTMRQQATDTDETTTRQQITDTDQTTTHTVSTSKPWKRAGRHETPRPGVRGPLAVHGQQIRGRQHSGDADAPTAQTAAADDVATTAGTSSPESRSVGGSPDARSPDGETDDC